MICFTNYAYKSPLDEIDWENAEKAYYDLTREEDTKIYTTLLDLWNSNPVFDNESKWRTPASDEKEEENDLHENTNREWLDTVLAESLRQWEEFSEDRKDCTLKDFIEFTKEIAEMYFL